MFSSDGNQKRPTGDRVPAVNPVPTWSKAALLLWRSFLRCRSGVN